MVHPMTDGRSTNGPSRHSRRAILGGLLALAACGVRDYRDLGPANLLLLREGDTRPDDALRKVYLDIYAGSGMGAREYLGSLRLTNSANAIGLPENRPLLLYLGFEQTPGGARSAVRIPLLVGAGQKYRLTAGYGETRFDYALTRER